MRVIARLFSRNNCEKEFFIKYNRKSYHRRSSESKTMQISYNPALNEVKNKLIKNNMRIL